MNLIVLIIISILLVVTGSIVGYKKFKEFTRDRVIKLREKSDGLYEIVKSKYVKGDTNTVEIDGSSYNLINKGTCLNKHGNFIYFFDEYGFPVMFEDEEADNKGISANLQDDILFEGLVSNFVQEFGSGTGRDMLMILVMFFAGLGAGWILNTIMSGMI